MRLKAFRIFRYKSIVDSGECALSPDFTILIGKNESGKTAVLEALRDFDREQRGISAQAVSINGLHGNPELELSFEISLAALDAVLKESEFALPDELKQAILKNGIKLRKSYEGEYRLSDPVFESFLDGDVAARAGGVESDFDRITAKKQRLSEILDVYPVPDLKFGHDVQALQESIIELRRLVKSRLNFINDESQKVEAVEILHAMTSSLSSKVSAPATPRDKFMQAMINQLPRFIYFSDFKDILPFEISIDALKSNQTVCDFASLARLDLDEVITTQDIQRRINLLNRASAVITGAFFEHWEQDRIELIARPEGNKILFGVKEHSGTDFYKMEQRSRGFQWFLSFYLRINRYQNENVVLLIDEPGMNLHPMAQKNILAVMEKRTSPSMQILFSTHSSSLLDVQKIERIRCIVKHKPTGSAIVHGSAQSVDFETLMPVAAATGVQSLEKLKALFSGEKILAEVRAPAAPAPAVVEVKLPAANLHASTYPLVEELTADDQLLRAEKILKEKAAKEAAAEEDLELAAKKPLFKFFGR